jgi:hypothetical protein
MRKDIIRLNTKMATSKRLLKKKSTECLTNQTKHPWQEHYQQLDSSESMNNTVKKITRMPIASKFSNGFGKAVAILDYLGGKEDAFIPDKQEYKYRADAVINEETGKSMEYRDLLKDPKYREDWSRAAANEFGHLLNGVGRNADGTQRIVGTNTCYWIRRSQVPRGKKSPRCPYCSRDTNRKSRTKES